VGRSSAPDIVNLAQERPGQKAFSPPQPNEGKSIPKKGNASGKIVVSGKNQTIIREIPAVSGSSTVEKIDPTPLLNPMPPAMDPFVQAELESENEAIKAELAAVLRESGLSEDEIDEQLAAFDLAIAPQEQEPEASGDLSPEQLAEEIEMNLLLFGTPREEIDQIVHGFMSGLMPPE
jgi:hypothetical protein